MVIEGIPQVTHSHTKSSSLYKKIHAKTGADQGLGDVSLQTTLTVDLFLLLQAPWTLQSDRRSRERREEEKRF